MTDLARKEQKLAEREEELDRRQIAIMDLERDVYRRATEVATRENECTLFTNVYQVEIELRLTTTRESEGYAKGLQTAAERMLDLVREREQLNIQRDAEILAREAAASKEILEMKDTSIADLQGRGAGKRRRA